MQYQILQTNITRTVWQTIRRITNEILGVKRLSSLRKVFPFWLDKWFNTRRFHIVCFMYNYNFGQCQISVFLKKRKQTNKKKTNTVVIQRDQPMSSILSLTPGIPYSHVCFIMVLDAFCLCISSECIIQNHGCLHL